MGELFVVLNIVVLATTIWVACDSSALRVTMDQKPYHSWNGAFAWTLCCLGMWIIAFPYYLSRRSAFLRNPLPAAETATKEEKGKTPNLIFALLAIAFVVIAFSAWLVCPHN